MDAAADASSHVDTGTNPHGEQEAGLASERDADSPQLDANAPDAASGSLALCDPERKDVVLTRGAERRSSPLSTAEWENLSLGVPNAQRAYTFNQPEGGFMWLVLPSVPTGELAAKGTQAVVHSSLLVLDPTPAGPGELLCTVPASGSTASVSDGRALVDLHRVASRGSCPGTAVSGSVTFCNSFSCGTSGTIDGEPFTPDFSGSKYPPTFGRSDFRDGSFLLMHKSPSPGYLEGEPHWGLLVRHSFTEVGGEVFCVGQIEGEVSGQLTLSQFSRLRPCPGLGHEEVAGCFPDLPER